MTTESTATSIGLVCIHEYHGARWGIYCRHCGMMVLKPEHPPGDWEDDEEPTHYLDGEPIQ
jgi:hypothetical protein